MNILIAIIYMVLGVIAVGILGYTFMDKIMRKEIGDDYKNDEHNADCAKVEEDYDARIEHIREFVPTYKIYLVISLIWISWPVSIPIWLHKIHKTTDLEDALKFF